MYYYAYIDANNIVTGVYALPSAITADGYISITETQYNDSIAENENSLIGKIYNAETGEFEAVPVWSGSTDQVQYKSTTMSLSTKLDEIDTAISDLGTGTAVDAYTKTETDTLLSAKANTTDLHSHDNKTVLDGITADKVAAWDAGASGAGTPGADGEDGATFTPSVSADGVLSWTNDKGLTNPESVNIKGADGADGTNGTNGTNGVSPTVSVSKSGTVTTITITDVNGTHTATINDGANGADGEDGADGTEITASQILNKLITVDGSGSGLDADKLDGYDSSAFALSSHSHSGYASSSHTHSGYASSSHTHSDYFEKTGGTISGETNFSGGLVRLIGTQTLYNSGSGITLSSNNTTTYIAGNAIYSSKAISVSSDERLKENIADVDTNEMIDFVDNIDVKSFNYIGDDTECIGVIAQEVQKANSNIAKYLVAEDENGYLSVKESSLVFPLIAYVKYLTKEIEKLKK